MTTVRGIKKAHTTYALFLYYEFELFGLLPHLLLLPPPAPGLFLAPLRLGSRSVRTEPAPLSALGGLAPLEGLALLLPFAAAAPLIKLCQLMA